jgi:hypothetical protein
MTEPEFSLPANHLVIQILGDNSDPNAMMTAENSSFGAEDGEWVLRLLVSASVELLQMSCQSMTGGLRLTDVPDESRLKALDDSLEQAKRLLDDAALALRQEVVNPDGAPIVVDVDYDRARISEPPRLTTPEDLQP